MCMENQRRPRFVVNATIPPRAYIAPCGHPRQTAAPQFGVDVHVCTDCGSLISGAAVRTEEFDVLPADDLLMGPIPPMEEVCDGCGWECYDYRQTAGQRPCVACVGSAAVREALISVMRYVEATDLKAKRWAWAIGFIGRAAGLREAEHAELISVLEDREVEE